MWIIATDAGGIIAIAIGLMGLGGIVFTALRFRRDDTTAIVGQQDTILKDFKALNDELRITADRLRGERDECTEQVKKLRTELGFNDD